MNVVWTAPAIADLQAIRDYIARDSETYAHALILNIFEAVDRLEKFPHSGRIVPEEQNGHTREVIVGNYRVIYDVNNSLVSILTVLHGARRYRRAV